jgi:haloalkane dehalogenase
MSGEGGSRSGPAQSLPGDLPTGRHVTVNGIRLHVTEVGAGPAVVLLHGNPTSSLLWRNVVPVLVNAGWRAIVPDLAGFGHSQKVTHPGDVSLAHYVADLTAMIDLLGLEQVTLVCHDWGGPIGLSWAVTHRARVEGLVLMSTWAWSDTAPFHTRIFPWRMMHAPLVGPFLLGRHNALAGRGMHLSVVDRERFADDAMGLYTGQLPTPESRLMTWQFPRLIPLDGSGETAAHLDWLESELSGWEVPALVVWGREDDVFPAAFAERFTTLLPAARGPKWVTGRHFLQEDSGPEIGRLIVGFLESGAPS